MTAPLAVVSDRAHGAAAGICRDPAALIPEWQQLAREREAPPFSWPGWFERWSEAFGDGEPLLIEARDGDGRLSGVLPLLRRGSVLAAPSNDHTPRFEPLATGAGVAEQLFGAALDLCRGMLDVAELTEESRRALAAAAARRGLALRIRVSRRSPLIALEGGWPAYRNRISKSTWRTIRRTRTPLRAFGLIEVEWFEGGALLPDRLAEGLALEASGWKGEGRTAILSEASTARFYSEIVAWASELGIARLGFLRAGGRPVAFKLGLSAGGAFHLLKAGVDRSAPGSPGTLLTYESIRRACAEGLELVELGGREEPHKLHWSTGSREIARARVFAPTAAGRAARLRRSVIIPAARRMRARAR